MQPVLHMFWKDTRHLWKEIAVTWVMLGYLTRLDSSRTGYTPGLAEGWLNVLLPLAWSYLAALCILQDPVPGERQFWLTLPHRRSALFASKALFVIAFIQVPYFLSSVLIVGARDFNPFQFLPHLFEKQLFLLFVLTLPSMALATVAKNAAQYVILALAICGGAILTAGNGSLAAISVWPVPWQDFDQVPRGLVLLLLALSSTIILWIQYRDRLTALSRAAGIAGLMASAAVYLWLPPWSSTSLEAALRPGRAPQSLNVRLREGGQEPNLNGSSRGNQIFVPLEITGGQGDGTRSLRLLDLDIEAPGGIHIKADNVRPGVPVRNASLVAYISATGLILFFDRHTYSLVTKAPVTLKGHLAATFSSTGRKTALPESGPVEVPGVGKCASSNAPPDLFQDDLLTVTCESPLDLPTTRVRLTDISTDRHWDTGLGMSATNVSYPRYTWLSPMIRREGFFHFTRGDAVQPGSQWIVPRDVLGHYRVEIEPLLTTGTTVVAYQFPGVQFHAIE
jgi:hypothetical protein